MEGRLKRGKKVKFTDFFSIDGDENLIIRTYLRNFPIIPSLI